MTKDTNDCGCLGGLIYLLIVGIVYFWVYRSVTRAVDAVEGVRDALRQMQQEGTTK